MVVILKAQLPLHSTDPRIGMLVYTQDRQITDVIPITPEWRALFKANKKKVYAHAKVDKTGMIEPIAAIEDQSW